MPSQLSAAAGCCCRRAPTVLFGTVPNQGRLIAAGKPRKVAIVAGMRKLLTILKAMPRDQTMWDAAKCLQATKAA